MEQLHKLNETVVKNSETPSTIKEHMFRMTNRYTDFPDIGGVENSLHINLVESSNRYLPHADQFPVYMTSIYSNYFFELITPERTYSDLRFTNTMDIANFIVSKVEISFAGGFYTLPYPITVVCYIKRIENGNEAAMVGENSLFLSLKGKHNYGCHLLYFDFGAIDKDDTPFAYTTWSRKPDIVRSIWQAYGVDTTGLDLKSLYKGIWINNKPNRFHLMYNNYHNIFEVPGSQGRRYYDYATENPGGEFHRFSDAVDNAQFITTNDTRLVYITDNDVKLNGDLEIVDYPIKHSQYTHSKSMIMITKVVSINDSSKFALFMKPVGCDVFKIQPFNQNLFPTHVSGENTLYVAVMSGNGNRKTSKLVTPSINDGTWLSRSGYFARISKSDLPVIPRTLFSNNKVGYNRIDIYVVKGGYALKIANPINIECSTKWYHVRLLT